MIKFFLIFYRHAAGSEDMETELFEDVYEAISAFLPIEPLTRLSIANKTLREKLWSWQSTLDIAALLSNSRCTQQAAIVRRILQAKPKIRNLYVNHNEWHQLYDLIAGFFFSDPPPALEQLSCHADDRFLDILIQMDCLPEIKRVYINLPDANLSSLLLILGHGVFPALQRLDVYVGGYFWHDESYASKIFGVGLESLSKALRSCGDNLQTLSVRPFPLARQMLQQLIEPDQYGNYPSVDNMDTAVFSKLGVNLSGFHNAFSSIAFFARNLVELDELFLKCFRRRATLSCGGWHQESLRMMREIGDLLEESFHTGAYAPYMPTLEWIFARTAELVQLAHRIDEDAYSRPEMLHTSTIPRLIDLIVRQVRTVVDSDAKILKIITTLVECDSRHFYDCAQNLTQREIPHLLRGTNLEWRQKFINVNHPINGAPMWFTFSHDPSSINALLQHPELDVNARGGPQNQSLLEILYLNCPKLIGRNESGDAREGLRLLFNHPMLDTSIVFFPQNVQAINAIMSDLSLLDLFIKKNQNYESMFTNGVISKCQRNSGWLKKFRRIFLATKDDSMCSKFTAKLWRHMIENESSPDSFDATAAELIKVFVAETPSFVYTAAHGSKKDFHLKSKIKFENIKKILQKILPR